MEKERAAAAGRLREVSERYEQQLQTQRMRLVADADLRVEQLEAGRWVGGEPGQGGAAAGQPVRCVGGRLGRRGSWRQADVCVGGVR